MRNKKIKHLYALFNEAKTNREERLDFSKIILKKEITSFKELSEEEIEKLITALIGWRCMTIEQTMNGKFFKTIPDKMYFLTKQERIDFTKEIIKKEKEIKMAKKEQNKQLADIAKIAKVAGNNDFGKPCIQLADDFLRRSYTETDVIRTGSIALDAAIGTGGWPRGRIVEIFGPYSSGKTTVMLSAAASAQKANMTVIYIDAEHSLDYDLAKRMGVDTSKFAVFQPTSLEQALDVIQVISTELNAELSSDVLFIIDSVASLPAKDTVESDAEKQLYAPQARVWSRKLPVIAGLLAVSNTTLLLVNQVRDAVNGGPFATSTVPGGKAIKFHSSVRVKLSSRKIGTKPKNGQEGNFEYLEVKFKVEKNKVGPPNGEGIFHLPYGGNPIDKISDIANEAVKKTAYGIANIKFENNELIPKKSYYTLKNNPEVFRIAEELGVLKAGEYTIDSDYISVYGSAKMINILEKSPEAIKAAESMILETIWNEATPEQENETEELEEPETEQEIIEQETVEETVTE